MKRYLVVIFVLLTAALSLGQTTAVTLQVTDTDGQTWNNGTWSVQLTAPSGVPCCTFLIAGTTTPVPNQAQSGTLGATGGATLNVTPNTGIVPAKTVWTFQACAQAYPTQCYTQSFSISGTSLTVNIIPPAIRIPLTNPNVTVLAYTDNETTGGTLGAQYFNLIDGTYHTCTAFAVICTFTAGTTVGPTVVQTNKSNLYAAEQLQVFTVDSVMADLVVGATLTDPCCTLSAGMLWLNLAGFNGTPHLTYFDGQSNDPLLIPTDGACQMAEGCQVGSTGNLIRANNANLIGPNINDAVGTSLKLNQRTGDQMDLQPGTVTQFIQASPAASHIKCGYSSSNDYQCSFNGDPFMRVQRIVGNGTASMTTASIASGACGATVTVASTNVATTDVVNFSFNASVGSNPGALKVNAWPTAGNVNFNYCNSSTGAVTPTAATLNWSVSR